MSSLFEVFVLHRTGPGNTPPYLVTFFFCCFRLNRALEEAEKYKTALKKEKTQSKVSHLFKSLLRLFFRPQSGFRFPRQLVQFIFFVNTWTNGYRLLARRQKLAIILLLENVMTVTDI